MITNDDIEREANRLYARAGRLDRIGDLQHSGCEEDDAARSEHYYDLADDARRRADQLMAVIVET